MNDSKSNNAAKVSVMFTACHCCPSTYYILASLNLIKF